MKKFLILAISLLFVSNAVMAASFKADARTKRIPAGTVFQLEFLQPISTFSGCEGDSFVATLKNELSTDANVILPSGSVVRGSVSRVNTSKRFSRGAKLYLDIDHVLNYQSELFLLLKDVLENSFVLQLIHYSSF